MAAAETKNPRRAIPRACKRVFARVSIFYILSVLIVGMLVRSDDDRLNDDSGTAAQSPFVIAASAAGLKVIPSLVNAVVITSAWSSSNQALLSGTRVLYGLALKRQAPQIFLRATSWGVPYMCVLLQVAFMFLAFMSLSNGALTVFWWLVDLVACGVLISWITILVNHLRLILAMRKQCLPPSSLPWHSQWTGQCCVCTCLFLCILTTSRMVDACCLGVLRTDPTDQRLCGLHQRQLVRQRVRLVLLVSRLTSWTRRKSLADLPNRDIALVLAAYGLFKLIKRTNIVTLAGLPLREALDRAVEDDEAEKPRSFWERCIGILWD